MSRERSHTQLRPSAVFAQRLREMRKARGLSQTQLSEMLTKHGIPLNRAALLGIEKQSRRVTLDEALAITAVLNAVPAYMLTPPDGSWVELTANYATDGSGLRQFLQQGFPWNVDPVPAEALEDAERDRFVLKLAALARGLDDAARVVRDRAAIKDAVQAIVDEVNRREATKSGVDQ